ncbi:GTPase domain-containing protein [Helicobacter pylori]|uniref:GTPase domain-containing protein n=1 Tax=Helicobacter pylori TaxID=210 RepID=UPI001F0C1C25|nr:GTPase domain-containing protein [Helicobacter pylori]
MEVFQKLEFKSLKELESLKNNEEWENFTIAFYGETNAGKSTLIECLRLFFKEQSKVDQQERFKSLYSNYVKNDRGSEHALLELEKFQDGAISLQKPNLIPSNTTTKPLLCWMCQG